MVLPGPPIIEVFEYDVTETATPIGSRHIEGGAFAFVQRVSLGCREYTNIGTSGTLVFQDVKFNPNVPVSHVASRVAAMTLRMATSGARLSDLKVFLSQGSALSGSLNVGLNPAIIQYVASGTWQPNPIWSSGTVSVLPSVVPSNPNLFRQDGENKIDGNGDQDVSQFIYMNLIVPLGYPLGSYGICGSGLLRIGIVYDYSFD
jgi:hypothetical protein